MATVPKDHETYLKKRPFAFGCATNIFPPDELDALVEYGNWIEALATGTIQPLTPEHERFLRVHREETEPTSVAERAWVRLKGRREFESEVAAAPPPEPPEDYGIIEWDKEKCWW
jgi:uncharacterized protein YifE (UPF0438 family)